MRNIVVTGASSGIGAATVQLLLRHGYRVFGTVRSAPGAVGGGVGPSVGLRVVIAVPPLLRAATPGSIAGRTRFVLSDEHCPRGRMDQAPTF